MIETIPTAPDSDDARLVLRPNRSLSAAQLAVCFLVIVGASMAVAGYSFVHGNVFAPAFALVELVAVATCLALAWRRSGRSELIAIGPRRIAVRRLPELEDVFGEDRCWVRVELETSTPMPRVWLGARGRRVEVGACLGEGERRRLAARLRALLAGVPAAR